MTVRWTEGARRDLREYLLYLQERDPFTAQRAKRDIIGRVEVLGKRPGTGRPSRWPDLLEFSLTRWRKIIVYKIVPSGVSIVAFYDARRDLTKVSPKA